MRLITKRRLLLGVAGVLMSLAIAVPVAAAGEGHGTVDVNDVTKDPHGGLVQGSDGGERNLNLTVNNNQGAFLYEEAVEFDSNQGTNLRVTYYDERGRHPFNSGSH